MNDFEYIHNVWYHYPKNEYIGWKENGKCYVYSLLHGRLETFAYIPALDCLGPAGYLWGWPNFHLVV